MDVHISLPPATHKLVVRAADSHGVSVADLTRALIEGWIRVCHVCNDYDYDLSKYVPVGARSR